MTLRIKEKSFSSDGSIKYIFQNQQGNLIEGIYFRSSDRKGISYPIYHICISTQAGCALACAFCATGYGGFFGQLTPEEMKKEVDLIRDDLIQEGIEKETVGFCIVLMGMGEPFLNYDHVASFCYLAKETIPRLEKIGVSTVGIAPKIKEFADVSNSIQICMKLFISLHSPYDDQRVKIMPITKKYSIDSIIEACQFYSSKTNSQVTASYLLLNGYNDTDQHARDLVKLLNPKHFNAKILLFNEIPESHFQRPSDERAYRFEEILNSEGIDTVVQISKGRDVNGGCGQLVKNIHSKSKNGNLK